MSSLTKLTFSIPEHALYALAEMERPTGILTLGEAGGSIPPLATKLGGLPDLEAPGLWPQRAGKRLPFLVQIAGYDLERVAPGRFKDVAAIAIFFDTVEMPAGLSPADRKAFGLVVTKTGVVTTRIESVEDGAPDHVFVERPLNMVLASAYPPPDWTEVKALLPDPDQLSAYTDWYCQRRDLQASPGSASRLSKILGHPDPIQSDFRLDCEAFSTGRKPAYDDPVMLAESFKWELLIQFAISLETVNGEEIDWHDTGKFYLMVKAGRFGIDLTTMPIWVIRE